MQESPATAPIFLVGPMGAGKTTIGKALASALGRSFLDHDDLIVNLMHMSIPDIFAQYGEPYFRDLEHDCLSLLLTGDFSRFSREQMYAAIGSDKLPAVIAGGGGIAMRADNRALIKEHAQCLYLHIDVEVQYQRVKDDTNRPMIYVDDIKGRLSELFTKRDPQWREIAHAIIEADDSIAHIVQKCQAALAPK